MSSESGQLSGENRTLSLDGKSAAKPIIEIERLDAERLAELEHIYASAPIGFCVLDTNLRCLEINQWLADFNGVSVEDHIGRTIREIVPEIAGSMEKIFATIIESGEPALDVLVTGATPGHPGEKRSYLASHYPLLDSNGSVWRLSSIVRDVTEQRKAESELLRARDELEDRVVDRTSALAESNIQLKKEIAERRRMQLYFRGLLQAFPDAIILVDPDGHIRYANSRMESLFGYPIGALLGLSVEDLLPNRFRNSHPGLRVRYLTNPTVQYMGTGGELTALKKDGSEFSVEVSLSSVKEGNETLVLCGIRDLTARNKEVADAREIRDELARVLRVASMGELAESLAHELNQPLTGIVANAQAGLRLLKRERPDVEEACAALQDLASDGKRAGDIIRKLRDLLRRTQSEKTPQDINGLVHESVQLAHSELVEHNVALNLELLEDLPAVVCDRVQIQQLLINLVMNSINALGHISKGSRTLTIATAPFAQEFVVISVRDSGTGIVPEIAETVFDAFTTTRTEGMGMGLSISRTIVLDHGGRIWFENNVAAGATFYFTLPIQQEHAE